MRRQLTLFFRTMAAAPTLSSELPSLRKTLSSERYNMMDIILSRFMRNVNNKPPDSKAYKELFSFYELQSETRLEQRRGTSHGCKAGEILFHIILILSFQTPSLEPIPFLPCHSTSFNIFDFSVELTCLQRLIS